MGWWGKVVTPFFQEIAHIPFWIYDPRHPQSGGNRTSSLATTVDIPPTVLDFFGVSSPQAMQGRSLEPYAGDPAAAPARQCTIYGVFGGQVNVTDGRYVYMRRPTSHENG